MSIWIDPHNGSHGPPIGLAYGIIRGAPAGGNVPTDLQRYAGQMHGFFTLLMLPGSELGFQQVVKAVKACIVKSRKAQPAL